LFVESEVRQAVEIMKLSRKPVYCIETNEMYVPGQVYNLKANTLRKTHSLKAKLVGKAKSFLSKWAPVASSSKS
ncbi:MAG TPA: phosphoribosyltransferase, partial [Pseudomonas sp.]|nr:phosphoribosyltransferase [Pseudomonas sp.]